MLIIHKGVGAGVLLVGVLSALAMNALTRSLFDRHYYSSHVWPKFGTFCLAAVTCTAVGLYLKSKEPAGTDQFLGESPHHLFYIPLVYWGPIYFLLGLLYAIYSTASKSDAIVN